MAGPELDAWLGKLLGKPAAVVLREEGTIARELRERRWVVPRSAGECRSPLQAAKLRLLLCFLHSDRLTQRCPLALRGGRVPQTIADWFRAKVSAHVDLRNRRSLCSSSTD